MIESSITLFVPPSISGPMTIQLFDVRGRSLRESTSQVSTGQMLVPFDPGRRSAGVYFVRMDTGREVTSRKVVLVHRP